MRRLGAAIIVVLTAAFASSARAVTLVTPQGRPVTGEAQRWVAVAQVPTPAERVVLIWGACPYYRLADGCTSFDPPTIWLRRKAWSALTRYGLYNELAHLFDFRYLTDQDHSEFLRIAGERPGRAWWWTGDERQVQWTMPSEQFADAYALAAMYRRLPASSAVGEFRGRRWMDFFSLSGYRPTQAQHRAVRRLISRAIRRPSP